MQKPREKLLAQGPQNLTDAEILAIFIRTGIKGKSATLIAQELIEYYGSLRTLLNTPKAKLFEHKGFGKVCYSQLIAALELSKRFYLEKISASQQITNLDQISNYLRMRLRDKRQEVLAAVFLNNQHQILGYTELFHGTINMATIHARPIIEKALEHNACALILAHNHPSGNAKPSDDDINATQQLKSALALVDMRILDHIIIADDVIYSMAKLEFW